MLVSKSPWVCTRGDRRRLFRAVGGLSRGAHPKELAKTIINDAAIGIKYHPFILPPLSKTSARPPVDVDIEEAGAPVGAGVVLGLGLDDDPAPPSSHAMMSTVEPALAHALDGDSQRAVPLAMADA